MVDRVAAGNPRNGLYFVLHSTVDPDPGNIEGKTGAWTALPMSYFTVRHAFGELTGNKLDLKRLKNLSDDVVVGAGYPENEIGIYFGLGTAREP
jgi:hypothetical protein